MLVRIFPIVLTAFVLTACGQPVTTSTELQKSSDPQCTGAAIDTRFIVKGRDGTIKVVQAENEDAFVNGYMKKHKGEIQIAEHDYRVTTPKPVQIQSADNSTPTADNWGDIKIEVDKLWAQNVRGAQIVVAVVDTGMDINHPQLQNQVFYNPGEAGVKANNGIDDDGNGLIDDYAGYDFADDKPLTGDNQFHGTHVSGIIGAAHTDTVAKSANYVQGVAPEVKILPLAFLDKDGSGNMSDAVRAIRYAVARGARVINASWGGSECSATLRDTIANLKQQNVIFVSAAGNDGINTDRSPEYPASLNLFSQFTVGATGDHDFMATYSNYGVNTVHIFAPGTNIVSTLPGGTMGFLSGTSMATPFVSGAIALLLSAIPDATADQVRAALYNSATKYQDYLNASQGRLDLSQALANLHTITGK